MRIIGPGRPAPLVVSARMCRYFDSACVAKLGAPSLELAFINVRRGPPCRAHRWHYLPRVVLGALASASGLASLPSNSYLTRIVADMPDLPEHRSRI